MTDISKPQDQLAGELADEKREWLAAIDNIYDAHDETGVVEIMRSLQAHVDKFNIPLADAPLNTPYINTIAALDQPVYPGNIALEKRIENIVRWNAMAMVLQAADQGTGVGGHIATYSSAATMLEVGFNHFFRAKSEDYAGDIVMPQPHAAPGIYARAYLEGRLSEQQLKNFRRELGQGGGLSSYPHPRSMPDFWQMPNASMGLSTPAAIYQARFAKYLENRGLKTDKPGKIWCFIGDGESDEPEVLGTINIAAREKLDNLVLVVNCNLQRLDGPVRGNGKIIQELERTFRGADWNVLKVIWGSGWDSLLAHDYRGVLRRRMDECLDGDYQRYSVLPGDVQREHWVEGNPVLVKMMNTLTDEEVKSIKRGGQDPKKIYAAFERARQTTGKPTVILVKTVKGDGMGASAQGRNTAHQKKNLSAEERVQIAADYGIPISPEAASQAQFYRPPDDSEEMQYLLQQRQRLQGFVPQRKVSFEAIKAPALNEFTDFLKGSGKRSISTTMVMVRFLAKLLRHKDIGRYVVPIVPDEARTFGMDGLFKIAGIYSPQGQNYTPVDADTLMPYREAADGQILQEGICETGAMASFMAAGSAYAVHGLPMIPFYIYYSIFGFQRVGDMIWGCGDMMSRGFLLGGTAGRTTLNGEGLQHQDGHSHVLASTVPNVISYDPAFGYEIPVIVLEGIRRMYQNGEDLIYYLTLYNEAHVMPEMPAMLTAAEDAAQDRHEASDEDLAQQQERLRQGILRGGYCYRAAPQAAADAVHILSSGSIMQQALAAAETLTQMGYQVSLWSITSFIELEREAQACERWNRLHPLEAPRIPYVQQLFDEQQGVFVAVTDYMKSLAHGIARWMPAPYTVLGTDGYGLSEARPDLRDFFEVSPEYIVQAALASLYREQLIDETKLTAGLAQISVDPEKTDPRLR